MDADFIHSLYTQNKWTIVKIFNSNQGAWRPYMEFCHSGATGFPGVGIRGRGPGLQIGDNLRRFSAPRRREYPLYTQNKWIILKMFLLQSRRLVPILGSVQLRRHWIPGGYGYWEGVLYRTTLTVTRGIR